MPECDQCGRPTDWLFDGVVSPNNARTKFVVGEPIKLSAKGRASGFGRVRARRGLLYLRATVAGFCKDEEMIRVCWEGNEQSQYYHMDFWTPAKRRAGPAATEAAKVCQRCRPPSNYDIQEMFRSHDASSVRIFT